MTMSLKTSPDKFENRNRSRSIRISNEKEPLFEETRCRARLRDKESVEKICRLRRFVERESPVALDDRAFVGRACAPLKPATT